MTVVFIILVFVIAFLIFMLNFYMRLSVKDYQTGLRNYRWFARFLEIQCAKSKKHPNRMFSVALIDIVNFRRFNSISISTGDEILESFAFELVRFFSDKKNIVVRYRLGDEFAVYFENINQNDAQKYMKDFVIHLDQLQFPISLTNSLEKLSVYYYVSDFQKDDSFDGFVSKMEKGLVDAKKKLS
jgi:diguanylate cyclase (GGDEF)-like protein